ncbi:MAG: regulatory protein RecX [Acidobacteriaceae bacterium]|nr:regulatory protein RecX [Acidobacteriaceae bacterium]MBV9778477.1 regulatory protein RecX [Acidobacteriaceae bacterium]
MAGRGKPKKLSGEDLWDYALRLLGKRAYSAGELKQKLALRSESPRDLAEVMSKLRQYGFADDTKFSEAFASSRLQREGFGRFRVLRDLRSKRVAGTVAEAAVEKTFAGTDESGLIQRFLDRKYRGKNLSEFLKEEKNLAAVYRRLRTAGFSGTNSLSVLKRYTRRAEEWNGLEDIEE